MFEARFMQRALALSAESLDAQGTEPFGAVVVQDGRIVGEGLNRSRANFDPTSHGEIEAIRDACRQLRTTDLAGCVLYTSCEPCALCVAAMHIAKIRGLFYAASLAQSAGALGGLPVEVRRRVDVAELRGQAGSAIEARAMPSEQQMSGEAIEILDAWAARRR